MIENNPQFGRVPYAIVTSGALSDMKPADSRLYIAICAHAGADWKASVGVRTLARETGLKEGSVSVSAHRLQALGVLSIEWHGNGRPATYTLSTTVQRPSNGTVQRPQNGREGVTVQRPQGVTVQRRRVNRSAPTERNRRTEKRTEKSAAHSCKVTTPRPRDEIWDSVVAAFSLIVTDSSRKRIGKVVAELKAKGAAPGDVSTRLSRYRAKWPNAGATPEALAKHWEAFAESDAGGTFDPLADLPDANDPRIDEIFGGGKRV